jgi:NAD(P)H-dependent flavin oxidoreductase YrpB (nitropropane dioxygenase family)
MVAVNVMVAIKDYANMVEHAIKAGVDAIISGAGLPLNLPKYVANTKVKIAPIVSSVKAAQLILKTWDRKYHKIPDFIIIEGSDAGGHLGFKKQDIVEHTTQKLSDILPDVLQCIKPYVENYKQKIPVFVAGGIYTGKDIKQYLDLGASGVQMATRFITTHECDASQAYKDVFINSTKEDIALVGSPVGMPGRAILTPLTKRLALEEKIPPTKCYDCLIPCDPKTTPYCISGALIEAAKGNIKDGLVFSGTNGYRNNKMVSVKEVIQELMEECNA